MIRDLSLFYQIKTIILLKFKPDKENQPGKENHFELTIIWFQGYRMKIVPPMATLVFEILLIFGFLAYSRDPCDPPRIASIVRVIVRYKIIFKIFTFAPDPLPPRN